MVFRHCPLPGKTAECPEAIEAVEDVVWLALSYCKLGQARFFGHLELSNIFARAVRRAKIGVQYSKGFHPMPRLSFDDPLPLGMASEGEQMRILVSSDFSCAQVVQGINAYLPRGVRITGCRLKSEDKKAGSAFIHRFRIDLPAVDVDEALVRQFMDSGQWPYRRTRRKGSEQTLDLRAAIKKVEIQDNEQIHMEIDALARPIVRPAEFLMDVLRMSPEALQEVVVTKLA
jgi:radical SAM-linked protein